VVSRDAKRWLEECARLKVRERTYKAYAHALRDTWKPLLDELELGQVTRRQINDKVQALIRGQEGRLYDP
jgi:Phage integrase, N-terminal SAM-like domain